MLLSSASSLLLARIWLVEEEILTRRKWSGAALLFCGSAIIAWASA